MLATWYEKGRSRKEALAKPAKTQDLSYLRSLLEQGRNRRDTDRTVIAELGFGVGIWNGGEESKQVSLRVKCGLYWVSSNANASLSNSVVLELPNDLGELKQAGCMSGVLAAVARAWEPDWAGVISYDAMNARAFNANVPFVDWMVFIPRRIERVSSPSSATRLDSGSLIVVQPDPPAVNDQVAQENIRSVENILRR